MIDDFAKRAQQTSLDLRELFPATPLQHNDYLSQKYGAEIWLKREDLTPVRSYKLRGAFNAMRKVRAADSQQGHFVCASAGNHAQGVAFHAQRLGLHAVIVMPRFTPGGKVERTRGFGAEVILHGDTLEEARGHA